MALALVLGVVVLSLAGLQSSGCWDRRPVSHTNCRASHQPVAEQLVLGDTRISRPSIPCAVLAHNDAERMNSGGAGASLSRGRSDWLLHQLCPCISALRCPDTAAFIPSTGEKTEAQRGQAPDPRAQL